MISTSLAHGKHRINRQLFPLLLFYVQMLGVAGNGHWLSSSPPPCLPIMKTEQQAALWETSVSPRVGEGKNL